LQDALKTAGKSFVSKVALQIESMKNSITAYMDDVKKHVQEFNEKFREAVIAEKERFDIKLGE
jgi:hypothetical protein